MSALLRLKKHFGNKPPIRCKSMIVTIMGDVVFTHGGVINTAAVIALNALFDIGKHSSRIGVSRLAAEDWLRPQRTGGFNDNRYRFGDKGLETFRQSAPLIYGNHTPTWRRDNWQLLLFNTNVHVKTVRRFIRAIGWLGYGKMLPTVYLCPTGATDEVNRLIAHHGLEDKVWLFQGAIPSDEEALKNLAMRLWNVKAMQKEYAIFMRKFGGIKPLLPQITRQPEAAMYLRLRLIHEYRRLVLHTPPLPKSVRNDFFATDATFAFCGDLYYRLAQASGAFITALGGDLAATTPDFARRFHQSDDDSQAAFAPAFPAFKLYA